MKGKLRLCCSSDAQRHTSTTITGGEGIVYTRGGGESPRSLQIFGVMPAANLVRAEGVYSHNDKNAKHVRKAANAVHIYREMKCHCLSNSNILLEPVGGNSTFQTACENTQFFFRCRPAAAEAHSGLLAGG